MPHMPRIRKTQLHKRRCGRKHNDLVLKATNESRGNKEKKITQSEIEEWRNIIRAHYFYKSLQQSMKKGIIAKV